MCSHYKKFLFPSLKIAPILPVSSINGNGVDKLLKTSIKIKKQLDKRINTPNLNKALKIWINNFYENIAAIETQ